MVPALRPAVNTPFPFTRVSGGWAEVEIGLCPADDNYAAFESKCGRPVAFSSTAISRNSDLGKVFERK
jgi:hypothetical protein